MANLTLAEAKRGTEALVNMAQTLKDAAMVAFCWIDQMPAGSFVNQDFVRDALKSALELAEGNQVTR